MRAAVLRGAQLSHENKTLFSFDTNLRLGLWSLAEAQAAAAEILPFADIVFPSDDEAETLTGFSNPDQILDHYLNYGAQIVALKRGAEGATIATPTLRFDISPAPSNPVDATGAGDSFAGAFLAYFIETGDLAKAGHLAAKVAAGTVSGFGAVAPIPRRAQVW